MKIVVPKVHLPKIRFPKFVGPLAATGFLVISLLTAVSVTANVNIAQLMASKADDWWNEAGVGAPNNPPAKPPPANSPANNPSVNSGNSGGGKCADSTKHLCSCNAGSGCTTVPCETYCGGANNIVGNKSNSSSTCNIAKGCTFEQVVNANPNTAPNTTGYDCKDAPGGKCGSQAGDVSGYYKAPNGNYYAIGGTGNDPSKYSITSLATKNACQAAVKAMQGTYVCNTAGGLLEFSNAQLQAQAQTNSTSQNSQTTADLSPSDKIVCADEGGKDVGGKCLNSAGQQILNNAPPTNAPTSAPSINSSYYELAKGNFGSTDIAAVRNQCGDFCKPYSNAQLQIYSLSQLKLTDSNLYDQIISQGNGSSINIGGTGNTNLSSLSADTIQSLKNISNGTPIGLDTSFVTQLCQTDKANNTAISKSVGLTSLDCGLGFDLQQYAKYKLQTATNQSTNIQSAPSFVRIQTMDSTQCKNAANGKYYAWMLGECVISPNNLTGTSATQFNNILETSVAMTKDQCKQAGGAAVVTYANGQCTLSPITVLNSSNVNLPVPGSSAQVNLTTAPAQTTPVVVTPAAPAAVIPVTPEVPVSVALVNPDGTYSQLDTNIKNVVIPNTVDAEDPNGHTLGNLGCGVIALTNIFDINKANLTPTDVLNMIPANQWKPGGISLDSNSYFLTLLNDKKYQTQSYTRDALHTYDDMGPNDFLLIGQTVSGTVQSNVAHITYLTKDPSTPNTFNLQANDYFGSSMKCTANGKADAFLCSNNKNQNLSIPANNADEVIVTPPNK